MRQLHLLPTRGYLIRATLVFAAYFVAGRIGLSIPFTSANVSPLWPPAGIALAAVLLGGARIWPAIAVGAFLVNYLTPIPTVAALGLAIGNTAGPLTGAWLLRRIARFDAGLTRLRDVLALLAYAALGGTAITATVGATVLFVTRVNPWENSFGSAWLIWWLGDAMGVLLVAPVVLTLRRLFSLRDAKRLLELTALLAGSIAASLLAFDSSYRLAGGRNVLALIVFPFVMWGAIRFEAAGAATTTFVVASTAVWVTARGVGPFVGSSSLQNATLLEAFAAVVAMSGLAVAGLVAERGRLIRLQAKLEASDAILLLSRAVEQTADSVIVTDRRGVIEYVNPAFETTTGYSREEAIGQTPRILKSGLHDAAFYEALWGHIVQGHPFRGTLVNRKRTGELFHAEQTITPVKDHADRITHFVSVLKDVTDLRRQQEQEVQFRLAREVQQRFYQNAISIPGFEVGVAAHPANETGGDYFDFISAPSGAAYIAIGDASGHGFGAALVMALTRAYVRSFAAMELPVEEVLGRVNQMLACDLEENRFVTLLLVRLDRREGSLRYSSAGHVPGFVLDGDGCVRSAMASTGRPLGIFPDSEFSAGTLPLLPGQLVLLLTDGLTERADSRDDEFGTANVLGYARCHVRDSARQLAEGLCHKARTFGGDMPQQDDLTAIVVKVGASEAAIAEPEPECPRASDVNIATVGTDSVSP